MEHKRLKIFILVAVLFAIIYGAYFQFFRGGDEIKKILATVVLDEQVSWYLKLIERVGPKQAQEDLFLSGLPFDGQSHLLNHTVGDYLYENMGLAGLSQCKHYFLGSCDHGFILNAIQVEGLDSVSEIMKLCEKESVPALVQCAHAVGHGFLAFAGYKNIPEALKLCDSVKINIENFPIYNCHDGVFMENIWAVHTGSPNEDRWVKSDDMVYPCNDSRIEEKYRNACWSNQPALMYQLFFGDIAKVGKECDKVKNLEYKKTCFNGLARQIHPITNGSAEKALNLCNLLPSGWTGYCVAVIANVGFAVGDREVPFEICEKSTDSNKSRCYYELFGGIRAYSESEKQRKEFCGLIKENEWREKCLN